MVDARGTITERLQVPTPSHSPQAVEDAIVDLVTQLRSRHSGVESVGIGAAGWVDNTQSIVRFSPTWPGARNRSRTDCTNASISR